MGIADYVENSKQIPTKVAKIICSNCNCNLDPDMLSDQKFINLKKQGSLTENGLKLLKE